MAESLALGLTPFITWELVNDRAGEAPRTAGERAWHWLSGNDVRLYVWATAVLWFTVEVGNATIGRPREEIVMAYGIMHFFPGGTQEQYEASMTAVHPGEGQLPEGQIFHAAGASPGGWTIIAVHDSQESWERFVDSIARPQARQGIEGGFPTPPQETTFEVHTFIFHRQQ